MTQNIYDDDTFFAGYNRLPRSLKGLDGAPEWPSLRALLPKLTGRRVLDLGCGFGWFCRWARENGAASASGIDVSEKMLARARTDTADPAVTYQRADMDELTLPPGAFDLVYSSLAFHYLKYLDRLFAEIHGALTPGGALVFSVEHPIFTAPRAPGWVTATDGRETWPVDHYLSEGPRSTDWLAPGVIKYHRTIGTYLSLLLRLGFTLAAVEEWGPSAAQIAERPDFARERERPPFLLVAARK